MSDNRWGYVPTVLPLCGVWGKSAPRKILGGGLTSSRSENSSKFLGEGLGDAIPIQRVQSRRYSTMVEVQ